MLSLAEGNCEKSSPYFSLVSLVEGAEDKTLIYNGAKVRKLYSAFLHSNKIAPVLSLLPLIMLMSPPNHEATLFLRRRRRRGGDV